MIHIDIHNDSHHGLANIFLFQICFDNIIVKDYSQTYSRFIGMGM